MAVHHITTSGTIENASIVMLSAKELLTQQLTLAAQNLSNADTIGFKGLIQTGLEAVYRNPKLGGLSPAISYVQGSEVKRDIGQGSLKPTGDVYNLALNGLGYFVVQVGELKQFTRDGRFRLDKSGNLVTMDGYAVQGESGELNFADYATFSVLRDGTVLGFDANGIQTIAGKLKVSRFKDEQEDLEYVGTGRFIALGEESPIDGTTHVTQGFLEQANVNPIAESIRLMRVMQMYGEAQRVIEMDDSTKSRTIHLRITSA